MTHDSTLIDFLAVEPTPEQAIALTKSQHFISGGSMDDFLIIRGSAGTGKSTLVKAITDYLAKLEHKFVLAAPTGKAAKVIRKKSGYAARTIHSLIYTPEPLKHGCGVRMVRKTNETCEKTTFIIDEASMISDVLAINENFISTKPLLTDLLDYIKQGNKHNQVIFIGDVYQLPPVGSHDSPALSPAYLTKTKGLTGSMVELTEVKRQDKDSYILKNATLLRKCMEKGLPFPGISCKMLNRSTSALYKYMELYEKSHHSAVTVLAWTDKDVNWFNHAVRDRLGYNPKPLVIGDQVSLHANWLGNGKMIMKGDTGIISNITDQYETYAGISFVVADIEFIDDLGEPVIVTTHVLLDALLSADGEIGQDKENELFSEVMRQNANFRQSRMPSDDKYIGAMRLRYGYATTCHKAQGGEWDNVILHPYIPGMITGGNTQQ